MPEIKKLLKLPLILTLIYIIKYMLLYFIQRSQTSNISCSTQQKED